MRQHPAVPRAVPSEASASASEAPAPLHPSEQARPEGRKFERPRVRRLGALPAVTTAFGGSFTP